MDVLKEKPSMSALIIVPTTNLRDNEWVVEITKWAGEDLLKSVRIECVQTLYTEAPTFYDIVVIDEVHTTLSPEYSKIHTSILSDNKLGLTATLPNQDAYKTFLNEVCPVVFTYPLDEGVKDEILSDYKVYNIPVKFSGMESAKYRTFDENFKDAQQELLKLKKLRKLEGNAFDIAGKFKDDPHEANVLLAKHSKAFWQSMTMRKWVCYDADQKIWAAFKLIQKFPDRK